MGLRASLLAVGVAVVVGWAGVASGQPVSWATAQAAELTRQAQDDAARGEKDEAARRLLQAIGFDATFGPAYLALGALHEAAGDAREAERAYDMGIEHVMGFADGYLARARLRLRQHRQSEAIDDLRLVVSLRPEDLAALRKLADAYVTTGALPAALATSRRLEEAARELGDEKTAADARLTSRAIAQLVREIDPVAAGATGRGPIRKALAAFAMRR